MRKINYLWLVLLFACSSYGEGVGERDLSVYGAHGSIYSIAEYNMSDNSYNKVFFDKKGRESRAVYYYNSGGGSIEKLTSSKVVYNEDGSRTILWYDPSNSMYSKIVEKQTGKNKTMRILYDENNKVEDRMYLFCDKLGKIQRIDNSEGSTIQSFKYDERDFVVGSSRTFDEDMIDEVRDSFRVDDHGNWVECRVVRKDNRGKIETYFAKRVIEYF